MNKRRKTAAVTKKRSEEGITKQIVEENEGWTGTKKD